LVGIGLSVIALVVTNAVGPAGAAVPAKSNPSLAIAKAAALGPSDVPSGFTRVAAKITKPKASGIKACKPVEAVNTITKDKWKSAFQAADGSSIDSTVDVFKSPSAMKKTVAIVDADTTTRCLQETFRKQLAKNKSITSTIRVEHQPLQLGDVSTSFVATIVATGSGQTVTLTSYAGFVGVGRAATQVVFTDQSGTYDPSVPAALMQAAATRLTNAQ
ncbi:MAG: hypothetical protein JWL73_2868, partial [Actinomycetia bacterium]|nr:hypothetical protein [Actinomycetes bacterium]